MTITLAPKDKLSPNRSITITNTYAPNSPTKGCFQQLTDWFFSIPPGDHIIRGDMNMVAHEQEDRKHTPKKRMTHDPPKTDMRYKETALAELMTHTHLTDTWRYTHPLEREYI